MSSSPTDMRKRREGLAGVVCGMMGQNVRPVRPEDDLHPKYLPEIVGKLAARDIEMGGRFSLKMVK